MELFNQNVTQQKISIAPMMKWTDRHFRYLMRLITKKTLLYTEMVTAPALIHNIDNVKKIHYLLEHSEEENLLVLQLGGDDPRELAKAIQIAELYEYDAFNLNLGCPSNKAQSGNFGACLMGDIQKTTSLFHAMASATDKPVSIKCRIGTDINPAYEDLARFVEALAKFGCTWFVVHARIAILRGLSPKKNRKIPPLRYEDVYRLKKDFPELTIEINGGIIDWNQIQTHLKNTDGVMLGRIAYENPLFFLFADNFIMGQKSKTHSVNDLIKINNSLLKRLAIYCQNWEKKGGRTRDVIRHTMGLVHGLPKARQFRQTISEIMTKNLDAKESFDLLFKVIS